MTDENGTEATRSDAPSADESLFGDAAGDAAAATVEEQDPKGETAEDGQGSDDAEEQAAGDETEASEDLKVVVSLKGGRATIGVQQPASDPYIESFDGISLLNWFSERCSNCRLKRLPTFGGIPPLNWLKPRSSQSRLERLPISGGSSPLS